MQGSLPNWKPNAGTKPNPPGNGKDKPKTVNDRKESPLTDAVPPYQGMDKYSQPGAPLTQPPPDGGMNMTSSAAWRYSNTPESTTAAGKPQTNGQQSGAQSELPEFTVQRMAAPFYAGIKSGKDEVYTPSTETVKYGLGVLSKGYQSYLGSTVKNGQQYGLPGSITETNGVYRETKQVGSPYDEKNPPQGEEVFQKSGGVPMTKPAPYSDGTYPTKGNDISGQGWVWDMNTGVIRNLSGQTGGRWWMPAKRSRNEKQQGIAGGGWPIGTGTPQGYQFPTWAAPWQNTGPLVNWNLG